MSANRRRVSPVMALGFAQKAAMCATCRRTSTREGRTRPLSTPAPGLRSGEGRCMQALIRPLAAEDGL